MSTYSMDIDLIKQAVEDGAPIQCKRIGHSFWKNYSGEDLDFADYEFRILTIPTDGISIHKYNELETFLLNYDRKRKGGLIRYEFKGDRVVHHILQDPTTDERIAELNKTIELLREVIETGVDVSGIVEKTS